MAFYLLYREQMTSNNRRLRKGVLAFGLLACLSPLSIRASIARAVPFEEKVTEAEGKVKAAQSDLDVQMNKSATEIAMANRSTRQSR